MHAIDKVERMIVEDPNLKQKVEGIMERVGKGKR
jgi:hypothetical protein